MPSLIPAAVWRPEAQCVDLFGAELVELKRFTFVQQGEVLRSRTG